MVPSLPHLHLSSSWTFHLTRFTGEGRTSSVDWRRKPILDVFHFQTSLYPILLSSTCSSHFVTCLCYAYWTRWPSRISASILHTYLVAAVLPSCCDGFLTGLKLPLPSPNQVCARPMMSLCTNVEIISSVTFSLF